MNKEQINRLEAEADEALKQAMAPLEDKSEQAKEAEAQAKADVIEPLLVEPEIPTLEEPKEVETEASEDNSTAFDIEGMSLTNAQVRIRNAQASYENARKKMTQASMEASDLRKSNEALKAQLDNAQMSAQMPARPPSEVAPPRPETPAADDLSSFVDEYGEDFNPLVNNMRTQQQLIDKMSGQLSHIEQSRQASANEQNELAHRDAILKGHADAYDIVDTPDFQGWASRQPKEIQDVLRAGSPESVIRMLSSYKEAAGTILVESQLDKQQQLLDDAKAAADPAVSSVRSTNAGQSTRFTRDQIKRMSLSEYEQNADQIDQAMLSGQLL